MCVCLCLLPGRPAQVDVGASVLSSSGSGMLSGMRTCLFDAGCLLLGVGGAGVSCLPSSGSGMLLGICLQVFVAGCLFLA